MKGTRIEQGKKNAENGFHIEWLVTLIEWIVICFTEPSVTSLF